MITAPFVGCTHRSTTPVSGIEQLDSLSNTGQLHAAVAGFATGVAEWEIHVQIAGYTARFDNIKGRANNRGRNAIGFQMPGYQTHGLVTDRSQRYQQRQIYLILLAQFKNARGIGLPGVALAVFGRYTKKPGTQLAHNPFFYQMLQVLNGQE